MWLVYSPCDCEDPGCCGMMDFALFESEQTAKQEADQRSKRYGGFSSRPDMHIRKMEIKKKTTGY